MLDTTNKLEVLAQGTLKELIYKTSLQEYIQTTEANRLVDLLALVAFSDVASVAPALTRAEQERLLDYLIESRSLSYIPELNIKRMRIDLPTDISYPLLECITVDEMNLTQILVMISNNLFPSLRSLSIFTCGNLTFAFGHSIKRTLRKLAIHNASDSMLEMPNIEYSLLTELSLYGYSCEFRTVLPKRLVLEKCQVKSSFGLSNSCEEMLLKTTIWERPLYPSRLLSIIGMSFDASQLDTTNLEMLTLEEANVSIVLDAKKLRYLKMLDLAVDTTIVHKDTSSLKELVLGYEDLKLNIGTMSFKNVTKLSLKDASNQFTFTHKDLLVEEHKHKHESVLDFPLLKECLLFRFNGNLKQLFENLPKTIEKLTMTGCVFSDAELNTCLKPHIRDISFFDCVVKEGIELDCTSTSMKSLCLVHCEGFTLTNTSLNGNTSISTSLNTNTSSNIGFRLLCSITEVPLMSITEFHLYCISKSNINVVYKEYIDDFYSLLHMKTWSSADDRNKRFLILNQYSYNIVINQLADLEPIVLKNLIHSHDQTRLFIGRDISFTSKELHNLYENFKSDLDTKTNDIEPMLEGLFKKLYQSK